MVVEARVVVVVVVALIVVVVVIGVPATLYDFVKDAAQQLFEVPVTAAQVAVYVPADIPVQENNAFLPDQEVQVQGLLPPFAYATMQLGCEVAGQLMTNELPALMLEGETEGEPSPVLKHVPCLNPLTSPIVKPKSESGAKKSTKPNTIITTRNKPKTIDKNLLRSINSIKEERGIKNPPLGVVFYFRPCVENLVRSD